MEKFSSRNLESFGGKQLPLYLMLALLSACGEFQDVETVGEKWNLEESFDMGFDQGRDLGDKADVGTDADMGVDLGEEDMGGVVDMDLEVDMSEVTKTVGGYVINSEASARILGFNDYFQLRLESDYDCEVIALSFVPKQGYEAEFDSNIKYFSVRNLDHILERRDSRMDITFIEGQELDETFDITMATNNYGKNNPGIDMLEDAYVEINPSLSEDCVMTEELEYRYKSDVVFGTINEGTLPGGNPVERIRSGVNLIGVLDFNAKQVQNTDKATGEQLDVVFTSMNVALDYSNNVVVEEFYLKNELTGERYEGSIDGDFVRFTFEDGLEVKNGEFESFLVESVLNVEENEDGGYAGTELNVSFEEFTYTSSDITGTQEHTSFGHIEIRIQE